MGENTVKLKQSKSERLVKNGFEDEEGYNKI